MASLFSKVHILYLALYVAAHHTVKFTHEISKHNQGFVCFSPYMVYTLCYLL